MSYFTPGEFYKNTRGIVYRLEGSSNRYCMVSCDTGDKSSPFRSLAEWNRQGAFTMHNAVLLTDHYKPAVSERESIYG